MVTPNRFRFRAWYKDDGKMCRVAAVFSDTECPTMIGATLKFEQPGCVEYRDCLNRSITLMQSTGLVDEAGIEIFEGDILDADGEVKWCKELAIFYVGHGNPDDPEDSGQWDFVPRETQTVIGNRYQHPHLLRG